MTTPRIVSHEEWLKAAKAQLAKEKEFTHQREELARERRELPWEKVEKSYVFDTPKAYGQETPGLSAFRKGDDGTIYRTYSTYARGLDVLNGTYHLLDMTSKGRDEDPKHPMAWVRRHDRY